MIYLPCVQQFFWSCAHQLSYQRGHHIVDGPQSRVKMTRTIQDGALHRYMLVYNPINLFVLSTINHRIQPLFFGN